MVYLYDLKMGRDNTFIWMEIFMLVNGRMASSTVRYDLNFIFLNICFPYFMFYFSLLF